MTRSPRTSSGGSAAATAAGRGGGRLAVFAVFSDGTLHVVAQTAPNGGWGGWSAPLATGLNPRVAPGAERDGTGRLHVMAGSAAGGGGVALVDVAETVPNGAWTAPAVLPTTLVQILNVNFPVKLLRNADGRLEAFATGYGANYEYSRYLHATQNTGGGWSAWASLGDIGGEYPFDVAREADGRLALYSFDSPAGFPVGYRRSQARAGGAWGDRSELAPRLPAGVAVAGMTVAAATDGHLEMFVVGSVTSTSGNTHRTELWHSRQSRPNGTWTAWRNAGSVGDSDNGPAYVATPALSLDPSGRLQFVTWKEGDLPSPVYDLWLIQQRSRNGTWNLNPSWPEPTAATNLPAYVEPGGNPDLDHSPSRMVDDDRDRYFLSSRPAQTGDYVGVDLGVTRTVRRAEILMGTGDRPDAYLHHASVECATDGLTWTTLGSFADTAEIRVSVPSGVTCRHLRVRATAGQPSWVAVREINVAS